MPILTIEKCSPYDVSVAFILLSSETRGIAEELEVDLLRTDNVCLLPTRRPNQKKQYPSDFCKLHREIRRRVETMISQLTQ